MAPYPDDQALALSRREQGSPCSQCGASAEERFLRAHYTELVSLGVGKNSPGLSAGLPSVHPPRPERKEAVDLLLAIGGASGQVEMHAVLDRLGISDRHEADADGRVLVGPDDDLVLALGKYRPAKCLGPEQGQARQIVSVNDDVVKSYGHAASMRGTLTCISRTRAVTALPGDLICRVADVSVMAMRSSSWPPTGRSA
jgi:hypothetical protein